MTPAGRRHQKSERVASPRTYIRILLTLAVSTYADLTYCMCTDVGRTVEKRFDI